MNSYTSESLIFNKQLYRLQSAPFESFLRLEFPDMISHISGVFEPKSYRAQWRIEENQLCLTQISGQRKVFDERRFNFMLQEFDIPGNVIHIESEVQNEQIQKLRMICTSVRPLVPLEIFKQDLPLVADWYSGPLYAQPRDNNGHPFLLCEIVKGKVLEVQQRA